MAMSYTIYCHINIVNAKRYIGQTKYTIQQRWNAHLNAARRKQRGVFLNALRKYGAHTWKHEILEIVETKLEANAREQFWISRFRSTDKNLGYNVHQGGAGGLMPDDIRKAIGIKLRGRKQTTSHRQKIREATQEFWSSPDSDGRRQQLINKNKSAEGRRASSEAQHRRWSNPAQRDALSQRMRRPKTDEEKRLISEALKKRWQNPQYREMMTQKRNRQFV